MSRFPLLILAALLALLQLSAAAAPVPKEWQAADYPTPPRGWWGVAVARFPKESPLAAPLEKGLANSGWIPTTSIVIGNERVVVVGQTDRIAEAWYLREELRARQVAEGQVVALPTVSDARAMAQGDFLAAFTSNEPAPAGVALTIPQIRERARGVARLLKDEEARTINEAMDAWERNDLTNPVLPAGAVQVATILWEKKQEPEVVLFLASKVAADQGPDRWVTTAEQRDLKLRAQDLMFELLYGHRRDWRAAWRAASELAVSDRRDEERLPLNKMRQAALLVDLINKGLPERPSFAEVRELLREAMDQCPEQSTRLQGRIEVLYAQTFAWEGNWGRVDRLTRGMKTRYEKQGGYPLAMAKVLHGVSLTRYRTFDEALAEIDEVIFSTGVPEEEWPRMGMETRDPLHIAREWRDTVRAMAAKRLADAGAPKLSAGQAEPAAAAVPVPAKDKKEASSSTEADSLPPLPPLDAPPPAESSE